ncbi:MAG TPA: GNAT family N-acetyltransferase [Candidatus Sulfotelmatobacter sp.]|nr:GNAT family N-acetyltransferase [Candidatus Sulfotelmatobacter sp.]
MTRFRWGRHLPVLAGPRLELRALQPRDTQAIFNVFSDPEVMRYWSSLPLERPEEALRLILDIQVHFRERRLFQWGIARKAERDVIGTCTLFHLNTEQRRAEIGYALGRHAWGQGYATEALAVLIGFAFERLGLHRLEADTDPRNARSIRALERQGFRREGLMRERWRVGGETQDALLFGLLEREWTRGED